MRNITTIMVNIDDQIITGQLSCTISNNPFTEFIIFSNGLSSLTNRSFATKTRELLSY